MPWYNSRTWLVDDPQRCEVIRGPRYGSDWRDEPGWLVVIRFDEEPWRSRLPEGYECHARFVHRWRWQAHLAQWLTGRYDEVTFTSPDSVTARAFRELRHHRRWLRPLARLIGAW